MLVSKDLLEAFLIDWRDFVKKDFEIEEIIPKDLHSYISEQRENGLFLSDYQISVLTRYGFSYQKYNSMKELLFDINTYLNSDSFLDDVDSLDLLSRELEEREYYSNTNH